MKTIVIACLAAGILVLASCSKETKVKDPIDISSPSPTEQISKVTLTKTQQGYVSAGNAMSFKLLGELYEGKNMVCSPLSLQYALAMAANGASGETLQEIIDFLGYGSDGIDALNEYNKILLEQLPAVDLDIKLKVTDALIVNEDFQLQPSFKSTMENYYYAVADNMDFSDPEQIAARINDWTKRNTNGFISKLLDSSEISPDAVAYLMNALYFKAKWSGSEYDPMFRESATFDEDFTLADGSSKKLKMMHNSRWHKYAELDGFRAVALPYAGGKFYMYILLPDKNDLQGLLDKLQTTSWSSILGSFTTDAEVHLRLPKFDIENKMTLNDALSSLGVERAFKEGVAEFDRMFDGRDDWWFWISKILQKARISVSEWGTEAAAVTVVEMVGEAAMEIQKEVYFYADHPFVFLIGEATSGTILFEGTFTGK